MKKMKDLLMRSLMHPECDFHTMIKIEMIAINRLNYKFCDYEPNHAGLQIILG